jgi:hypothetical protein
VRKCRGVATSCGRIDAGYIVNAAASARTGWPAQLLDVKEYRLEQDFVVAGDERSYHILNAVSPAFTCAIPFAEFVLDEIERLLRHGRPLASRP